MKKIVNPCRKKVREKFYQVFCKIEIKDSSKGKELSITGVVGPLRSGDAMGSSGQILDDLRQKKPVEEKLKKYSSTDQFQVIDTIGVPHPYCISSRLIAYASDHFNGMLGKPAIESAEAKGIHCDICEKSGNILPFEDHKQALLIEVDDKRELKSIPELQAYLLEIKEMADADGYVGFAFNQKENASPDQQLNEGWDTKLFEKFLDAWERWHLNGMNAECEHQRMRGETYTKVQKIKDAEEARIVELQKFSEIVSTVGSKKVTDPLFNILRDANRKILQKIFYDAKRDWMNNFWRNHPANKCPDCGYRIGTAWLYEDLPQEVIEFLESLPETKIKPNWV